MAAYKIEILKSAAKELEKIGKKDQDRIIWKIRSLANDPRQPGTKRLSGEEKYRIRQGDYRILYEIKDEIVTVVVVKIRHRREVYKKKRGGEPVAWSNSFHSRPSSTAGNQL
jgi:mRNA interferase RelE/StbE